MELDFARAVDQAGPHQGGAAPCLSLRVARQIVLFALALGILSAPAVAFAADSPHGFYNPSTDTASDKCSGCHKPHVASLQQGLLSVDAAGVATQSLLCFKCHGSAGPASIDIEGTFSDTLPSGHRVEDSTGTPVPDLTNTCSSCHDPHSETPGLPGEVVNGQEVTRTPQPDDPTLRNSWCLACHDPDAADRPVWSGDTTGTAYYDLIFTSRDASGYPTAAPLRTVDGTFRGVAAYNASAHATIPASDTVTVQESPLRTAARGQGDCLWCHASHRSESKYDNLRGEFGATSPGDPSADLCLGCHPAAEGFGSGHLIRSEDASLAAGSPLPCYECHNPHGSKNGNTAMISDALGGNLNPRGTAAQARQFCFSCHTTGNATPAGWDSDSNNDGVHDDGAYTTTLSNTAVGTTVVGISRTAAAPMRLSSSSYHLQAGAQSCLACHDDAHNPGSGASNGGKDCYICHTSYMDYMEDGTDRDTGDTEAGVGSSRTAQYHHVMGSATKDGDEAVGGTDANNFTNYPAAGTDVYCVSCHVDHDKFNSSKSSSLRSTIAGTDTAPGSVTAANSDFNATNGGVCLGCHYLSRTKDTTNRKSDGTSVTPVIPDTTADTLVAATTAYNNSSHQYGVTGRARNDDTTFSGDCSKCHSDGQTGLFYKTATTGNEFGLHYDSSRRILEALGRGAVSDPYAEERFCYSCHSTTAAGFKATADRDWYGAAGAAMDAASQAIYAQMGPSAAWRTTSTGAGHMVDSYAGLHKPAQVDESRDYIRDNKHVECADCHSPHAAGATLHTVGGANGNAIGTNSPLQGVWGVQPSTWPTWASPGSGAYNVVSPATREYQICFKCHSGYNSAYTAGAVGANGTWSNGWGSSGVNLWTDVALEFNTASNASFHPVAGGTGNNQTWLNSRMLSPWLTVNQTMTCSDCHQATDAASTAYGPHGSAVKKILRGYWPTNSADGTGDYWTIGTMDNDNLLCWQCHNRANFTNWTTVHQRRHASRTMSDYRCVDCHLVVPHGGKLAGLIGDGDGNMPSRYARANNTANTIFTGYNAGATTNSGCGTTCGGHTSTNGADW